MTRTFVHQFEPKNKRPKGTGAEVELTVKEIEDAGYQEMLQTSGAGELKSLPVWLMTHV